MKVKTYYIWKFKASTHTCLSEWVPPVSQSNFEESYIHWEVQDMQILAKQFTAEELQAVP